MIELSVQGEKAGNIYLGLAGPIRLWEKWVHLHTPSKEKLLRVLDVRAYVEASR